MRFFLFILFLFVRFSLIAQIQVFDQKNHSPIPFVQLLNEKGSIVCTADVNGILPYIDMPKKQQCSLQHISYKTLEFSSDLLQKRKSLYLLPMSYALDEVTIHADQPDYICLKGYYRSYQFNDSLLKYYSDGIVEYFIPLRKKKLKFKLLQYRSFRSKKIVKLDRKRAFSVSDISVAIPYIECLSLMEEVKQKYDIIGSSIFVDSIKAGSLSINDANNSLKIELDRLAPKKQKTFSLFGYTSTLVSSFVIENSRFENDFISRMNLLNRKEYIKKFYHYKKDKKMQLIESVSEFYVIDRSYMTKAEMKKVKTDSNGYGMPCSHNYTTEYWRILNVPKLSSSLQYALDNKLEMY